MNSLFFSLLFSLGSAAQGIGFYNAGLDPAPLKWWQTKWCNNPVELGINNNGMTTTVTFNINPSTTLSLGVLEVTFPTGFDVTSSSCSHITSCFTTVSSQLVSLPSITMTAGTDYSYTIEGVILPTSTGGYGPFALRTRHYTGGQTVDINLNFASVGIFKDRGSLTNLTVTTVNSSIKVGATGNTLSFKFQIAKDLWKNDIFRITASQYWTISTSSTCSTATYSGRINNFNGTRSADPHNLDCYISPKTTPTTTQTIIIYGLNNDIDVSASDDNKFVDLRLTSVSNPDADYSDSSYTWTVETLRGQTKSVIEYATASSGPSTDPGTLTSASFAPTWGWSSTNVQMIHYIYTNFGFTTVNKISQGGSAEVLYTDTIDDTGYDGNTTDDCWLHNYLTYTVSGTTFTAKCTGSVKTVTIAPLPEVASGTTLTITVLTYFDTTSSAGTASATVTTKNASSVEIDKASGLGGLILGNSSNNYAVTTFELGISDGTVDLKPDTQKTDTTTSLAGHTATLETIMFKIKHSTEDLTLDTQITLKFPFIQSTSVQNFEFAIPSSGVTYYLQSQADGTTALTTTIASSSITITPSSTGTITNGAGLGSYVFKVVTPIYLTHLTYFAAQGDSTTQIRLPRYKSNAATRYEAYLETKDMAITPIVKSQYGVWQIEIISNTFYTDVLPLCVGLLNALPLKVVITPNHVDIPPAASSTSYIYELDFTTGGTTDLGSGLANGNDYPYSLATSTFSSFTLGYGSSSYLRGKLGNSIGAQLTTSILYTVIYSNSNAFSTTHRGYYTIDADPRNKYQTHEKTASNIDLSTPVGRAIYVVTYQTSTTIGINTAVTTWTEGGLRLNYNSTDDTRVEWAISYPKGWTLSGTSTVGDETNYVNAINLTPSSDSTTRYVFALTTQLFTAAGSFVTAPPSLFIFKGAISSNYVLPDAEVIFSLATTDVWGNNCKDYNTAVVSDVTAYTMTGGTITVVSISPNSIKGRGPASVNLTEVVVFTVPHLIPAGGYIVATVDSNWGVAYPAACSVSGLTNQSTTITVIATLSSNTCTLTNFAEVSANSSITLTFTGLLPPTYTSNTSNTSQPFLSSIVSSFFINIITTYQIDSTSTAVVLTIAAANSTGRSSFVTKTTYPQNAMATDVDLYLKFSLANSVPMGGVMELTSPLTFKISSINTKNQVWLTPLKYSAVSFSSNTLSITLAEDYTAGTILELYIEKAVDNPTSAITTSTGFTLKSTWGGAIIDTDVSQTLQSTQQFTASAAPGSTLTASPSNSLTSSPTTAGEYASYSFNFESSSKFASGDQIWIDFPNEFDPFLGDFWPVITEEGKSYYVGCSSPQLEAVLCKVERGIVVLSIPSQLASNALTVSVSRVKNPPASTTGNFRILHMDSQVNLKSYNMAFGNVTPTALPKGSELMTMILNNEAASSAVSTLTATFTLEEDIQLKHNLRLLFPPEYELSPSFEVSCTVWVRSRVLKQWAQSESYPTKGCSVTGNSVELPFPTQTVSSQTYDLLKLTLLNAPPPYSGWSLPEDQLDVVLKVADSDVYHASYDLLTTSFTVQVFDSTTLSIKSSSYPSFGRSFAGFSENSEQMMVNNYDAKTKANSITVQTGSESNPILISLSSPSQSVITLKPSCSLPSLSFHSPSNFTIQAELSSTTFTITATASVSGVFFIEWTAYQDGVSSSFYTPPRTLIEVQGLKELYVITVQSPLEVTRGSLSFPFQVSCSQAPALELSVIISSSPQVTVNPQVITLTRDQPDSSFQVLVDVSANNTDLSFNLTGPGAQFYTIDSVLSLNVTDKTSNNDTLNGTISSWGVSTCQRTTCVVTPSVTAAGTLYWHLRSKGRPELSFQELKGRSSLDSPPELVNYFDTLLYSEYARQDTQPQSHEGFPDFQARLLRDHLQKDWVGVDVVEVAEFSFSRQFYWLLPDTEYNLTGYLYDGVSTPQPYSETFRTLAAFPTQPFEVNLKEASDQKAKVKELAAKQQGVPAYQLGYADTKGRRLQSGGFSFVLYSDLTNQGQSPTSQAKFSEQGLEEFRASLKAIGVQLDTVGNLPVPQRVTPTWQVAPSVADLNQTAVLITLQSSVEGKSCCCVEQNSTQAPTAVQVYMGLSAGGQPLASQCVKSNMTGENYIAFYNLTSVAVYSLHCVAMDNFPIVPTYMDNVTSLDFQTEANEDTEDLAGLVSLSLIVLLSLSI